MQEVELHSSSGDDFVEMGASDRPRTSSKGGLVKGSGARRGSLLQNLPSLDIIAVRGLQLRSAPRLGIGSGHSSSHQDRTGPAAPASQSQHARGPGFSSASVAYGPVVQPGPIGG